MKKITAAVLILFMLASLSACAGVADPNAGIYKCTALTSDGVNLAPEEIFGDGENQVGLKSDGSGIWIMNGEEFRISWRLDGDRLTVMQGGNQFEGTLSDGVMTVEYAGAECLFLRADAANRITEETEQQPAQPQETAVQKFWNGQWYGWWIIENGKGSYEGRDYSWWDCCAEIELDGSGKGSIVIWDELNDRRSPLAELNVEADEGSLDAGLLISMDGQFKDSALGYGQWVIEPGEYAMLDKPLIIIDGEYSEREDSESGFSYYIYLRPWGERWDDIEKDDPSQLPRYYYDCYIPLIEAGETAPEMIRPAFEADAVLPANLPETEEGSE